MQNYFFYFPSLTTFFKEDYGGNSSKKIEFHLKNLSDEVILDFDGQNVIMMLVVNDELVQSGQPFKNHKVYECIEKRTPFLKRRSFLCMIGKWVILYLAL